LLFSTEWLSAFHRLRRIPLLIWWLAILLAALIRQRGFRRTVRPFRIDPVFLICEAGIIATLALTGITAAFSPSNSTERMAYYMPRVVYWAEQWRGRYFPTSTSTRSCLDRRLRP
jgi:hypothetical protein